MTKLVSWMRIVGLFYLFLFVSAVFLKLPIEVEGPPGVLDQAALGDPTAKFVIDTWVVLGLMLAVIGSALLIASRIPAQAKVLVWTVIANEFVWGIGSDIYKIFRGYEVMEPVIWIIIHSIIIITGVLSLRKANYFSMGTDTA